MNTVLILTALTPVLCYTGYRYIQSTRKVEPVTPVEVELISPFHEIVILASRLQDLKDAEVYPLLRALRGIIRLAMPNGYGLTNPFENERLTRITGFLTPYTLDTLDIFNACEDDAEFLALLSTHLTPLTGDLEQAVSFYNQEHTKHLNSPFPKTMTLAPTSDLASPTGALKELIVYAPLPLFVVALAADIANVNSYELLGVTLGVVMMESLIAYGYLSKHRKRHAQSVEERKHANLLAESIFGSLLDLERIIASKNDQDKLKLKPLLLHVKEWNHYYASRSSSAQGRIFQEIDPEFTELHEAIRKISFALYSNVNPNHPPLQTFIDITIAELEQKYPLMPRILLGK